MDTIEWYEASVGGASENAVAIRAGINQRTLNRQIKAGRLTAETVAAIASAYGRDVLDGLVAAGLISRDDIRRHGARVALAAATDREIADEVWRRLTDGRAHAPFDEPAPALRVVSDDSHMMAASDADVASEVEAQQVDP